MGTTIHVTGDCFGQTRRYDGAHPGVFLLHAFAEPRDCELRIGEHDSVFIDRGGSLRGSFVVASRGGCTQHRYTRRATPARYVLGVGCMACTVAPAEFRVVRR